MRLREAIIGILWAAWFAYAAHGAEFPIIVRDPVTSFETRDLSSFRYDDASGPRLETTDDLYLDGTLTLVPMTTGSVLFIGASDVVTEDNTNFFWDDSNNRLGIATATPSERLQVAGNILVADTLKSATDLKLQADSDNNGTNYFSFLNGGGTEIFNVTEAGNLQADGSLSLFGTTTTNDLNLEATGSAAGRTIGLSRPSGAVAGDPLRVIAGGGQSGGTDLNGGDLHLKSGISTGTGTSSLGLYTATASGTGTSDNTPTVKVLINGAGETKTQNYTIWKDFSAHSSIGHNTGWTDGGAGGLVSTVDDQYVWLPIHFNQGSTLTRIRIKFAGTSAATGVLVRIQKRDESGTTTGYTTVGAEQTMVAASTTVTTYNVADETFSANTSYHILIRSEIPAAQTATFYAWGVETSERVM